MGGKFNSAQGSDLAPFYGNGTKIKIPSEIKPPLEDLRMIYLPAFFLYFRHSLRSRPRNMALFRKDQS